MHVKRPLATLEGSDERIIQYFEEVQASLLYVVGIAVTISVLISLQTLFRSWGGMPFEQGQKSEDEQADNDEPTDESGASEDTREIAAVDIDIVLNSWYNSKLLIPIILLMAVFGLVSSLIEDPSWIDTLYIVALFVSLVGLSTLYGYGVFRRAQAYRRVRQAVPWEYKTLADSLDVAIVGIVVFSTWILYVLSQVAFDHKEPMLALIVLTFSVAVLAGLVLTIVGVVKRVRDSWPSE